MYRWSSCVKVILTPMKHCKYLFHSLLLLLRSVLPCHVTQMSQRSFLAFRQAILIL